MLNACRVKRLCSAASVFWSSYSGACSYLFSGGRRRLSPLLIDNALEERLEVALVPVLQCCFLPVVLGYAAPAQT